MKPETANPMPVGTRVMVIASDEPRVPVGSCGVIASPYEQRMVLEPDGAIVNAWGYLLHLDRCAPVHGRGWFAAHRMLVPITPTDPIAEPREVEAPQPDEALA